MDLHGKVAIAFGGASGIGEASAKMLARDGAAVIVSGLPDDGCQRVAEQIVQAGGTATAVPADVRDRAAVAKAFEVALQELGGVDILYNGAGVVLDAPVREMSEEQWDWVLDVNLKGIFLACQQASLHLRPGGSIINVSSVAGLVGQRRRIAYCASKAGILGLTRSLAVELAPQDVRVNAVCPGATETAFFEAAYSAYDDPEEMKQAQIARHPLGRLSAPEDIANTVVFLASDRARMVTGAAFTVDGGFTAV